MRSILNLAVPILTLMLLLSGANAATYSQTLAGGRWIQRTINVYVSPTPFWTAQIFAPVTPDWARTTVLEAMQIWNQAQNWFLATNSLNPNYHYTLTPVNSQTEAQVTVKFLHAYEMKLNGVTGYTTDTIQNHIMQTAAVELALIPQITIPYNSNDTHALRTAALHELGLSLGLWDLPSTATFDLMMPNFKAPFLAYPSTMDLYAVYLLASNQVNLSGPYGTQSVALPSTIQYTEWNPTLIPTPESAQPAMLLSLVVTLSSLTFAAGRKQSRREPRPTQRSSETLKQVKRKRCSQQTRMSCTIRGSNQL